MSDFISAYLSTPLKMAAAPPIRMVPGRWWRVIDKEGGLWMETSNEAEARAAVREGDILQNLWVQENPLQEWRTQVADTERE